MEEKKKAKVEFLPNHDIKPCWTCEGKDKNCRACGGTGWFKDCGYFLIYTTKTGQKIAFAVDSIK